jgi:hypothetical protein
MKNHTIALGLFLVLGHFAPLKAQTATELALTQLEGGELTAIVPEDAAAVTPATAESSDHPPLRRIIGELDWHTDYATAWKEAQAEGKMLFLFFRDYDKPQVADAYERDILSKPELHDRLENVVRVVLPLDAQRPFRIPELPGKKLIKHSAFRYMYGRQGIAMIDLTDPASDFYGQVVSAHAFTPGKHYTVRSTGIVLRLPRGTVTQRALIYAVLLHPAAPISTTNGKCDNYLCRQARHASKLMSQYGSVAHHDWGYRSNTIMQATGRSPSEVAAMSGSRTMIDAAIELVNQWYGSPPHWSIMSTPASSFGYDLFHDAQGNWWGIGLYAN